MYEAYEAGITYEIPMNGAMIKLIDGNELEQEYVFIDVATDLTPDNVETYYLPKRKVQKTEHESVPESVPRDFAEVMEELSVKKIITASIVTARIVTATKDTS